MTDLYHTYQTRIAGRRFTIEGRTLRLLFTPSDADNLVVEYYKSPTLLSADADIPDVPFPYSSILMWDALLALKAYASEPSGAPIWAENRDRLKVGLYTTYGNWGQGINGESNRIKFGEDDL